MKTPREILLERHQSLEPKLNAIRQNALASLARPGVGQALREFVFPMRWHLAGMSAVWMVVLLLNIDSTPASMIVMAGDKIPSARVLVAALLNNRRELIELTETPTATGEPAAAPPRRSENQSAFEIV